MGYCIKCGRTLDDKEFYKSKNIEKYPPDGKLNTCKKCLTLHVDNWDPETYKWILQEIDVPYIKEEWDGLLERYGKDPKKVTGVTIIGRYLSKMKLKQWSEYSWEDSDKIAEDIQVKKVLSMQAQGLTEEEIQEQLAMDRTPPKPKQLSAQQAPVPVLDPATLPDVGDLLSEHDEFEDQLTDEDKIMLRLKWGRGYRAEEWVRMEQLYNDMMNSYDIHSAGHKDTLIMICKASLKVNQLLDAGDIDGAQKMAKVYDSLMKSGKFTEAQRKEESGEAVDSIGELVAMCERDKFIPQFYVDKPNDKVDRVIQDMQAYTRTLVTEELGLGNLIENSVKALERERESIQAAAADTEQQEDDDLFDYDKKVITDEEFIEMYNEEEGEDEPTELT